MGKDQVISRLLAIDADIDHQHLRAGLLEDEEWERLSESAGPLAEAPVFLSDWPGPTLAELCQNMREFVDDHDLDLLIVDYLQLIHMDHPSYPRDIVQEMSEISRTLKNLARELRLPILAISQLPPGAKGRWTGKPTMRDLSDYGTLMDDADLVMFLFREEVQDPYTERLHIADVIVGKNRHGAMGEVSLHFWPRRMRYRELELLRPDWNAEYKASGEEKP